MHFRTPLFVALVVAVSACNSGPIDSDGIGTTQQAEKGSGGGATPAPTLPPNWPAQIPIPVGTIYGSTGSGPTWSVGIVANGSVSDLNLQIVALYTSNGFTQQNGLLVFDSPAYLITAIAENRDHSNTKTNVTVALQQK